jgi:hypothetical protein
MPVEKSLHAYRKTQSNCAQSVLCGFQDSLNIPDAEIEAARRFGGGRAEGGRCGALHAALQLTRSTETRERLQRTFKEKAGSEYCREIRTQKQLTCDACVELAASILVNDSPTGE